MNGRSKQLNIVVLLLCFIVFISACTGNSNTNDNETSVEVSNPEAYPRTITDATGEITISKQPQRIALVHWGLSDILLTFDLSSVGIALPFTFEQSVLDTDVYKPYVSKIDELVIVGENTAVNLEALLAYGPDLILAGSDLNKGIQNELSKIAQTVFIDEEKVDVWQDWQAVMTIFGDVLGQEQQAQAYISDFNKKISDAKDKLATIDGTVAFVQVREKEMWLQGTSYLPQYYEELGLTAPDTPDKEEGGPLTLEGLSALNPDHLFLGYFNVSDPSIPALTDEWENSEVWKLLNSVKSGQAYPINGELALGFGPIGKAYGIDAIVEALQ